MVFWGKMCGAQNCSIYKQVETDICKSIDTVCQNISCKS